MCEAQPFHVERFPDRFANLGPDARCAGCGGRLVDLGHCPAPACAAIGPLYRLEVTAGDIGSRVRVGRVFRLTEVQRLNLNAERWPGWGGPEADRQNPKRRAAA